MVIHIAIGQEWKHNQDGDSYYQFACKGFITGAKLAKLPRRTLTSLQLSHTYTQRIAYTGIYRTDIRINVYS